MNYEIKTNGEDDMDQISKDRDEISVLFNYICSLPFFRGLSIIATDQKNTVFLANLLALQFMESDDSDPDKQNISKYVYFLDDIKPDLIAGSCGHCLIGGIEWFYQCTEIKEYELRIFFFSKDDISSLNLPSLHDIAIQNNALHQIIDNSFDGIFVTDKNGLVLLTNSAHERISGIPSYKLEGHYMKELVDQNLFSISLTEDVIKQKKTITATQTSSSGREYSITSTPIFDASGQVQNVITNVRDISELISLEKELDHTREIKEKYRIKLSQSNDNSIVIGGEKFAKTMDLAKKVANKNSAILIQGETGVGKDVVARYIHQCSDRRDEEYLSINCGAIPPNLLESELFGYVAGAFTGASSHGKPGYFELAKGGTLFLDEIGELPLNLQSSLLHVLQNGEIIRIGDTKKRKVDVRLITATNRDLKQMVKENRFRMDLYYRINILTIYIPPLRERLDEIPAIAESYLNKLNVRYGTNKMMTHHFIKYLCKHDWPGNIRELQNFIEQQYIISDTDILDVSNLFIQLPDADIDDFDANVSVSGLPPLNDALDQVRAILLERALKTYGTTYKAAEALGISQPSFSRMYNNLVKSRGDESGSDE